MYVGVSNNMEVKIIPCYQDDLSSKHNFFWECQIFVRNNSNSIIQLIGRHWQIIASDGAVQEVIVDAIVGERPVLKPGEVFEYKSLANLKTSSGIMRGCYKMLTNGKILDIEIPAFSLDNPYEIISIN